MDPIETTPKPNPLVPVSVPEVKSVQETKSSAELEQHMVAETGSSTTPLLAPPDPNIPVEPRLRKQNQEEQQSNVSKDAHTLFASPDLVDQLHATSVPAPHSQSLLPQPIMAFSSVNLDHPQVRHIMASSPLVGMTLRSELLVPVFEDNSAVATIHAFSHAILKYAPQWKATGLLPKGVDQPHKYPVGLFREWFILFRDCPGYLKLAPLAVQQTFANLTPAMIARLPSMSAILYTGLPKPVIGKRGRPYKAEEPDDDDRYPDANKKPARRMKMFGNDAVPGVSECRGMKTDEPVDDNTPCGKKNQLARGVQAHRLSSGHLRALREISHLRDKDLPKNALTADDHEFRSHCTAAQANITHCDFSLSIEEILTYFPLHTIWRAIAHRCQTHGWTAKKITEYIVWVRQLSNEKAVSRTVIQHHFQRAQLWHADHPSNVVSTSPSIMGTASGLRGFGHSLTDYFLVDLAEGVTRHPTGPGARMLTVAIQHALATGDETAKLSELRQYVANNNLTAPGSNVNVQIEDRNALLRLGSQAELYYKSRFVRAPL